MDKRLLPDLVRDPYGVLLVARDGTARVYQSYR
jgi:hypothetical protein